MGVLILMCLLWVFFLGARSVSFDWVFIDTRLSVVVVGVLQSGRLKMQLCFSVLIGAWPIHAGEFSSLDQRVWATACTFRSWLVKIMVM